MNQPDTAALRILTLSEADEPALQAFYREGYGGSGTHSKAVAPAGGCPFTAGVPAPIAGVYDGAQIVGHLGSIPTEFWDGTRQVPAYWLKGFLVLERLRNGPIGFLLAKHMSKVAPLSGVMVVAPAARRLFAALGYKDMGALPNYVTIVRPVKVLRVLDLDQLGLGSLPGWLRIAMRAARIAPLAWLGGGAVRCALALLDGINRLTCLGLRTEVLSQPPPAVEIDALWERQRTGLDFGAARSGGYIHWRYAQQSAGRYQFLAIRRGAVLAALVVVRRPERTDDPRLAGLQVGLVVDLVADPADAHSLTAALLAARAWARRAVCDAVLLTISHRGIARLATRLGYARLSGNVHFLLRTPAGSIAPPKDMQGAWLTRGDAWGDDI